MLLLSVVLALSLSGLAAAAGEVPLPPITTSNVQQLVYDDEAVWVVEVRHCGRTLALCHWISSVETKLRTVSLLDVRAAAASQPGKDSAMNPRRKDFSISRSATY
jgi:hypothetical protein